MKRKKILEMTEKETQHKLVVYENKFSYYAKVINIETKKVIMSASFKDRDNEMSIDRVKEYFNFK